CASRDVPRPKVRTFGLPWTHIAPGSVGSRGSYQAPVESWTTPGRTAWLTIAPAKQLPRSLKTRTTSPLFTPRAAASAGCSRLAPAPFGGRVVAPATALAVTSRGGMGGDQMQGEARGQRRPEPLRRLEPGGMARTVGVAESVDGRREDLDLAAGRAEGRTLGIGSKLFQQHQIIIGPG